MPPRAPPRVFQLLVKTHRITVFLTFPNTATVAEVKEEVLSALVADISQGFTLPKTSTVDDFALTRGIQGKGHVPGQYDLLDDEQVLKDVVSNWEILFVRFKDISGELLPVEVTIPSLEDDQDSNTANINAEMEIDMSEESSVRKGKRKAVS
ncbi:hypothetical protein OF83DRAFT_106763 [Amylostereum chailletii]|nr:hypothetical protein OF83DRAFT_106763 [Amylostereum chailletii]